MPEEKKESVSVRELDRYKEMIKEAMSAAEAGNKAKSDFLANVSHELRTPLNGIFGAIELMKETDMSALQNKYLSIIHNSSKNLQTIIDDILDYNALEENSLVIRPESINLLEFMEQLLGDFFPYSKKKNLNLYLDFGWSNSKRIFFDPDRLYQIFSHLIKNSIKFTHEGSITFGVRVLKDESQYVDLQFFVEDTGIGIPDDKKNDVFNMFTQIDPSKTRKYGGTGLGLSLCKKLVMKMGGEIEIDSHCLKGFHIFFNLSLKKEVFENIDQIPDKIQKIKIHLCISNESDDLYIKRLFKSWGVSTEVFDIDSQNPFDLVNEYLIFDADSKNSLTQIQKQHLKANNLLAILSQKESIDDGEDFYEIDLKRSPSQILSFLLGMEINRSNELIITDDIEEIKDCIRVLLVEDNALNQNVIAEVLKKLKVEVDVASNGFEAVEKFRSHNFDLIFMDCQMPGMDGYTSTKKIRELEGPFKHTPIVALTAHVLERDRKVCLDSGMDDYLFKPASIIDLKKMIIRWATDKYSFKDDPVVDLKQAYDLTGHDIEILKNTMKIFLDDFNEKLPVIERAINELDFKKLKVEAHTLKSSSAYIGALRIKNICLVLEKASKARDLSLIHVLFQRLKFELVKVNETYEAYDWKKIEETLK